MKKDDFPLRLLKYLIPYKKQVAILFLLVGLSAVFNVLPPLLLQYGIDGYLLNQELTSRSKLIGILLLSGGIIGVGILIGLQGFIQKKTSQKIGHKIVKDMRNEIFIQINNLSFEYFDETTTGDVVSRIISDTERLRNFTSNGFIGFITNFFMLIGVLVVLFTWNYRLGLLFLGIFPFLFTGMWFFTKKVLPAHRRSRKANGYLVSSIQECFNGMKEIKLYGREEYIYTAIEKWNEEYFDAVIEANNYQSIWRPYVPLILNICSGFFMLIGGLLIIGTEITTGSLIATLSYFGLLVGPVKGITGFAHIYNHARASAERIFEILDRDPIIKDNPNAETLEILEGKLSMCGVSFAYKGTQEVLRDINLEVNPGEIIALVGPSGVGKTTLAHLIPRFYDISEGSICIDGKDIRNITLDSLRKNIGIVLQTIFLFNGTIKDNICYGREDATLEEIQKAAQIAQIDEFIQTLPEGYNNPIGERGVKLSGGQAQRLSLARVLVTNPKLLILDEPTANVDAITDQKLMNAVRTVMEGRTTIVIAHRLWTIKNADKIVLLKNGAIEAIGSHEYLLEQSPFYREFFASQFSREDELEVIER